ncbi:MAG: CIR N-terminal domain-containing protein [Nitrososphaerota archaeon]
MPIKIGGQIINPILLALGSMGTYMFFDYIYHSRKKKKIPAYGVYHMYEVGLTEDEFKVPEKLLKPSQENVKSAQYFPPLYTTIATKLPLVSAIAVGVVVGDYLMDKIRKQKAKKEYDKLQREFDQQLNEAILLAKIKSDIKSASMVKTATITNVFFNTMDSIMNGFVRLFTPDLTHRDIVHLYTYSITPYVFWSSYRTTAKDLDTADKTKAAILGYMKNQVAALPVAAVIPALQKSVRLKAQQKAKEEKKVLQQSLEERQKMLERLFNRDISQAPGLTTEYKNRQTLEDIYSSAKTEL